MKTPRLPSSEMQTRLKRIVTELRRASDGLAFGKAPSDIEGIRKQLDRTIDQAIALAEILCTHLQTGQD
jgi:hypothetical protein